MHDGVGGWARGIVLDAWPEKRKERRRTTNGTASVSRTLESQMKQSLTNPKKHFVSSSGPCPPQRLRPKCVPIHTPPFWLLF